MSNRDPSEDVNITIFTHEIHECYIKRFVDETFNCAVLDNGCNENVSGQSWLKNHFDSLTKVDRSQVSKKKVQLVLDFEMRTQ